jgi:DNA topoisomerase VI subunit B
MADRQTIIRSRDLEFFEEQSLRMEMGCDKSEWPIALLKELIDNGLDACERDKIGAPRIDVEIGEHHFVVADNASGIPSMTVAASANYTIRVSTNSSYVGPTRGQQGNALKTVWTAAAVASDFDPNCGCVVEARGIRHRLTAVRDHIARTACVRHDEEDSEVISGTFFRVNWPKLASTAKGQKSSDFYIEAEELLFKYAIINPQASFSLDGLAIADHTCPVDKWEGKDPTSLHWYSTAKLTDLLRDTAHMNRNPIGLTTPLDEFLAQFKNLKSPKVRREVLEAAGIRRGWVEMLVDVDPVRHDLIAALFKAAKEAGKPIPPGALGRIGQKAADSRLRELYGAMGEVKYKCREGVAVGFPFVVEAAFARADVPEATGIFGVNWSPCLRDPPDCITRALSYNELQEYDSYVWLLHIVHPSITYTDRGKGSMTLPEEVAHEIRDALRLVMGEFAKEKRKLDRAETRLSDAAWRRAEEYRKARKISLKDAAYQVIEEAYRHAAGSVNQVRARQLMYATRKLMLPLTNGKFWKSDQHFTQVVLQQFIEDHPKLTADWNITWDARGNFVEPHRGRHFPIGTIQVDSYLRGWCGADFAEVSAERSQPSSDGAEDLPYSASCHNPGIGPESRYQAVLFVEKEGFTELFNTVELGDRYDLAICSTKGMSSTSMRRIVVELTRAGIPVLVLHDFDRAGFIIHKTLTQDTKRFQFPEAPNVIDIGIRIEDVRRLNLDGEEVHYKMGRKKKDEDGDDDDGDGDDDGKRAHPGDAIRSVATQEEIDFLVQEDEGNGRWSGRRVELNELTNDQLIELIENKLEDLGLNKKVQPSVEVLSRGFILAARSSYISAKTAAIMARAHAEAEAEADNIGIEAPKDIDKQVAERLTDTADAWNDALGELAEEWLNERFGKKSDGFPTEESYRQLFATITAGFLLWPRYSRSTATSNAPATIPQQRDLGTRGKEDPAGHAQCAPRFPHLGNPDAAESGCGFTARGGSPVIA